MNKNILATLDNDNQTKRNLINKDEFNGQTNNNNNISPTHLSNSISDDNNGINNSKKHLQFDLNMMNKNVNNIN